MGFDAGAQGEEGVVLGKDVGGQARCGREVWRERRRRDGRVGGGQGGQEWRVGEERLELGGTFQRGDESLATVFLDV